MVMLGGRRCTLLVLLCAASAVIAQEPRQTFHPIIPKTWVDDDMTSLEVPLANPVGSPKHITADYYYRIPVRPIYKQYPVYAPGHEPPGYIERLGQLEPQIVWDDAGHRPALETEADWVKAGEIVFDAHLGPGAILGTVTDLRDPAWYKSTGAPVTREGVLPFYSYVIRQKGEIEIGLFACAMCHTRVMPDGSVIKGAQGNFPFDRALAYTLRARNDVAEARILHGSYRDQ
jgi:hypothetical protein